PTLQDSIGLVPADPARSDFGSTQGTARDPTAPAAGRAGGGRGGAPGAAPGGLPPGAPGAQGGRGGAPGAPGAAPAGAGRGGPGGGEEGGGGGLTVQGLPLIKPPYGRITAIDLNKGEKVWQIAHGETADNVKNHPALK